MKLVIAALEGEAFIDEVDAVPGVKAVRALKAADVIFYDRLVGNGVLDHARREAELIPVWIDNLNRVMPKGMPVPIPLLCTVTFGAPVAPHDGEARPAFLARAREALLALAPKKETP